MRRFFCLFAAFFIVLSVHPQQALSNQADWQSYDLSAYNLNEAAIKQVGQAFGYIAAQDARSVVTAAQYPALAPRLKDLDLIFRQQFSNPKARSEAVLRSVFQDEFDSFIQSRLAGQLSEIAATQYSEAEAYDFLNTVEQRTEGRFVYPDILKTLLWLKYADHPAEEITDGWATSYTSKGDPKAAGLDIRLTIPFSWKERSDDRPHIVRIWGNQNGTGLQAIMLQIRNIPELAQATEDDIKAVFSEGVSDFLPEHAKLVGQMATEIDGEPALRMDYTIKTQRAGLELDLYFRNFMLFAKGRYISLACSGMNNHSDIEAINNMCFQQANALVIVDLWQ